MEFDGLLSGVMWILIKPRFDENCKFNSIIGHIIYNKIIIGQLLEKFKKLSKMCCESKGPKHNKTRLVQGSPPK